MSLRSLLVVAAAVTTAIPVAHADQLNGGVVKMELRLPASDSDLGTFTAPTETRLKRYFNSARCACDKAGGAPQPYQVRYTWETDPSSAVSQPLEIWVGRGCESTNPDTTRANCAKLDAISDPDALNQTVDREYEVGTLLAPTTEACGSGEITAEHWAVTETADAVWDEENRAQLAIAADLNPPPVPTELTVKARESGIGLAWDALTDRADDIQYFQALCAKADGAKAHDSPTSSARYQTVRTLCGEATDPALPAATLTNDSTPPAGTLPTALAQLDGAYVCGETSGGTAASITLGGLDNDTAYWVVLLAVDYAGNVAGVHIDRPITPRAVTDFWEELNNEDSTIAGGFCVAQVGTSHGLGSLALIGAAGLLAVRRRRRRARTARVAAAVTVALVLVPAIASAQTYTPYFPDDGYDAESLSVPDVSWTLGLRLGPYTPSVDAKFDSDPGPYERTFKFQSLMFAVDVHRVWRIARGQLGVGVTAGYYTNSANSFEDGSDPNDPDRPRVVDNITRLSILPTAITAIYRATLLDDEYGIPLVPYVRGGVAYHVWWSKNPADELSSTMDDRALGASIGLVGAVGLAVRAERIDADAAMSMHNSGLEHAGFFAELEYGWVDGFGSDSKMSLGDLTWFGGLSFEF